MRKVLKSLAILTASVILTGCGGGRGFNAPGAAQEHNVAIDLLLAYDTDQNRLISLDEFEGAMRSDFDTLDRNDDGVLDRVEASSENERRWTQSGSASTPLIDWNTDGYVDYTEFAGTLRTTYRALDRDGDGSLSTAELATLDANAAPMAPGPHAGAPAGAVVENQ